MNKKKIAKDLIEQNGGIAKTQDFNVAGISSVDVVNMCNSGYLTRICHGCYKLKDSDFVSEEKLLGTVIPQGVICVESALVYYGYSDYTPRDWSIAVPRTMSRRKFKSSSLSLHTYYVQNELYDIGKTVGIFNGVKLPIYDRERTICDLFKHYSKIDREVFVKALKSYVNDDNKNLTKLTEYAKKLRVYKKMMEIMEVFINE